MMVLRQCDVEIDVKQLTSKPERRQSSREQDPDQSGVHQQVLATRGERQNGDNHVDNHERIGDVHRGV